MTSAVTLLSAVMNMRNISFDIFDPLESLYKFTHIFLTFAVLHLTFFAPYQSGDVNPGDYLPIMVRN